MPQGGRESRSSRAAAADTIREERAGERRVHPRIKRTRKFHSVSGGIVRPTAAATPSARTPPEFQAVIVQTQFLYVCIKDCVWTSLLGMNVNVGVKSVKG